MLKINLKSDYAVKGLIYLAQHEQDKRVTCDEIAEAINAPRESFALLLKALAKKSIVLSSRGTGGGFRLARHPSKITLLDIILVTEGNFTINECLIEEINCKHKPSCAVHLIWHQVQNKFIETCAEITLEQMAK